MRIGIDICCWRNRRGFGRFTRELTAAIISQYGAEHDFYLVGDPGTIACSQLPPGVVTITAPSTMSRMRPESAAAYRRPWDMVTMGRCVAALRTDVFLFPTASTYYPVFSRVPIVVCLHDAMTEIRPDFHFKSIQSRTLWTLKIWLSIRQAAILVAPSDAARQQIAAVWKLPHESIQRIDEGPAAQFFPAPCQASKQRILQRFSLPPNHPIVLYVGGISPHKNLAGLMHALAQVPGKWHCVIVGDESNDGYIDCHQELRETIGTLALHDRVTFTGYISDDELCAFYNVAALLVLPSFDEGFGLPAVEAMACGLPVVASNRGSLPEVIGDAGLLVDPLDHGAMAAAVSRLLGDVSLRKRLSASGIERAKTYSWQRGAQQMMQILLRAAER